MTRILAMDPLQHSLDAFVVVYTHLMMAAKDRNMEQKMIAYETTYFIDILSQTFIRSIKFL
jgi:hypothetical protein